MHFRQNSFRPNAKHFSHHAVFTPNTFYTKDLVDETTFTPNSFYTTALSNQTFLSKFCTKQLLHQTAFAQNTSCNFHASVGTNQLTWHVRKREWMQHKNVSGRWNWSSSMPFLWPKCRGPLINIRTGKMAPNPSGVDRVTSIFDVHPLEFGCICRFWNAERPPTQFFTKSSKIDQYILQSTPPFTPNNFCTLHLLCQRPCRQNAFCTKSISH